LGEVPGEDFVAEFLRVGGGAGDGYEGGGHEGSGGGLHIWF
jgi:hypothetical protein